jgi:hypothetical protein
MGEGLRSKYPAFTARGETKSLISPMIRLRDIGCILILNPHNMAEGLPMDLA